MIGCQTPFFLASMDKLFGVELIIGTTADLALLDKQFQTVITHSTPFNFTFLAFPKFPGQEGIGKGLPAQGDHVTYLAFNTLCAKTKK
jgi:hypothetical protein